MPSRPLSPSRPVADEPATVSPLGPDQGARFARGRLIHRLLQTLPDLAPEARGPAARRWLGQPANGLDPAAVAALADETLAVLAEPDFAPLFGPGSRAEVPVAGRLGAEVVLGQVDRLLVTPEAVLIADYKTNRPPPSDPRDVAPLYLRQMALYRAVLRRIYPDRAVRCAIVWTDGPRLMPLDDALLDAQLADLQAHS
jgi:ATP-dependent helicase/nuclease subunit A